jgi:hypothetical protein
MRASLFTAMMITVVFVGSVGLVGCTNQSRATKEAETKAAQQKEAQEKVAALLAQQRAEDDLVRAERASLLQAGKLASINSICPVTGDVVDPAVAPVPVELMLVQPSEVAMIGVANEAAAAAVRRDPARYLPAAQRNQQARSTTHVGR